MIGMKRRKQKRSKWIMVLVSLCLMIQVSAGGVVLEVYAENSSEEIQEPTGLYAQAAVLMDADSGRILFAKNGQEERAMASTTKIMTCILALESGKIDETVIVSANAAAQPEVRLGMREGQEFILRDLLYSLMLESHNDSAVAIAETIGQSVEGFADMMNAKAKELHCGHTYFITPNGLDETDEKGVHHTTAEDLARIMKYCIMDSPQKSMFLEITRTPAYQFSDKSGVHSYSCNNHNAFLNMMKGALSGKTGFTSDAGYCYVGALESQGRTFVVALLACGWPNNKGYKWADTKKLMNYGMEHFHYQNIYQKVSFDPVEALEGIPSGDALSGKSYVAVEVQLPKEKIVPGKKEKTVVEVKRLLRDDEEICIERTAKKQVEAPVEKGEKLGSVRILLGEEVLYTYPVIAAETVECRDFSWCLGRMIKMFLY